MTTSTGKKTIKVCLVDFYDQYVKALVRKALEERYNLIYDEKDPDFLFYSVFGYKHLMYGERCIKVFVSGENVFPDFNECDYAVSSVTFSHGDRYLHLPPCYYYDSSGLENIPLPPLQEDMAQRRFCSFIYRMANHDAGSVLREQFCRKLMQDYKHVDCPGVVLHNMDAPELSERYSGNWNESKIKFLSHYKFNIAFENGSTAGYMTEKLTDAFKANVVPIYWGSEGQVAPFPKEAMICANDYPDLDTLIARIKEVDENDEEYMKILAANPLRHGTALNRLSELADFFANIIENGTKQTHGFHSLYTADNVFKNLYADSRGKRRLSTLLLMKTLHVLNALLAKIAPTKAMRESADKNRFALGAILWRERRFE